MIDPLTMRDKGSRTLEGTPVAAEPSPLRHIPNLICVGRILLVPPIVWALVDGRHGLALGLILVAGLSDGVDGYLARKFDWRTRLGGLLDPAADKLLVASVFITLTWLGLVPVWLTLIVLGRDVLIVGGAVAHQIWVAPLHGEPTVVSKLNTVFQISFMLLTVTHAWIEWPKRVWLQVLASGIVITIAISAYQYVSTGVRRALHARATHRA